MSHSPENLRQLIFIVGQSGAGGSTAIKVFEDSGFYCIDNLPFILLRQTFKAIKEQDFGRGKYAIGLSNVDKNMSDQLLKFSEKAADVVKVRTLFLDCSTSEIVKRFNQTRRKHPMEMAGSSISEWIEIERRNNQWMKNAANVVIDTTNLNPHELKRAIEQKFEFVSRQLEVELVSFGFKNGYLENPDLLFDVRCMKNPYFDTSLKQKTGTSSDVQNYVFSDKNSKELYQKISDMVQMSIPMYFEEGKYYLRIGVGCTGGQHRSVTVVENMFKELTEHNKIKSVSFKAKHRDL